MGAIVELWQKTALEKKNSLLLKLEVQNLTYFKCS